MIFIFVTEHLGRYMVICTCLLANGLKEPKDVIRLVKLQMILTLVWTMMMKMNVAKKEEFNQDY